MKKITLIVCLLVCLTACQEKGADRYTQSSPEIETVKAAIAAYEAGDWEGYVSHYADTAKIYHNTKDNPISPQQSAETFKQSTSGYSSYSFLKDEGDMEMVVTDEGETWVNYWGIWEGSLTANDKKFTMPVHLTLQFKDGKIVKEYGYYNQTELVLANMELQKAAKATDTMANDVGMQSDN
jgi:ketosteroid isomerase-like protein